MSGGIVVVIVPLSVSVTSEVEPVVVVAVAVAVAVVIEVWVSVSVSEEPWQARTSEAPPTRSEGSEEAKRVRCISGPLVRHLTMTAEMRQSTGRCAAARGGRSPRDLGGYPWGR
jgi:hypothetical protein